MLILENSIEVDTVHVLVAEFDDHEVTIGLLFIACIHCFEFGESNVFGEICQVGCVLSRIVFMKVVVMFVDTGT